MSALVRAELMKLRTTRTPLWLLVATLALALLTATVSIPATGAEDPPIPLSDPDLVAIVVGNSFGVPFLLVILLAGVAVTQEFRYGTITSTYLVEPRRGRILLAKMLALVLVSAVVTTATLLVSVPYTAALVGYRDGEVAFGAQFWQMAGAAYVVLAGYAVIGVSVGVLVRNQITAVVAVLVWMLVVEQIVVPTWPDVGRWLPIATAYSLMQLGPAVVPDDELLAVPAAGLLFAAYALVALTLALRLTPKRDVL